MVNKYLHYRDCMLVNRFTFNVLRFNNKTTEIVLREVSELFPIKQYVMRIESVI